ncbi:MAG: maleylpyruvate isomerase N-terminal domain-containing protein [Actinomycetota bacterium]|nr:maleylpyruvate isomerase N-terminal domain-containing protein [Actinomycetota bacterium]
MRDEYLGNEQASWDAFLQVVVSVPADKRTDPSVVPGWSVKDLVWHCAGWTTFAGDHLEQIRDGTFVDPFENVPDSHWDEVSQQMIDESRAMSFEDVVAGAERARERARTIWSALPTIDAEAGKLFADETFSHYDEHTDEIRRFTNPA